MPGGQASHKGHSVKPNVNASGVTNEAADLSQEPMDMLPEELTNNQAHRAETEAVHYPPAMERPHSEGVEKPQDQESEAQPE